MGLRLCAAVAFLWRSSGYLAEARRRLELAIKVAGDEDNEDVGRCLVFLALVAVDQAEYEPACNSATRAVAIFRRQSDSPELSYALKALGWSRFALGDRGSARAALEEAAKLADNSLDDPKLLAEILTLMAMLEGSEGNLERSYELDTTVLAIWNKRGDERGVLGQRQNMACTLREMGRLDDALLKMRGLVPDALRLADPVHLVTVAEDFAAILAEVHYYEAAARLLGAAEAMRERYGVPRPPTQEAEITDPLTMARAALAPDAWHREYQYGRNLTVEDALIDSLSTTGSTD